MQFLDFKRNAEKEDVNFSFIPEVLVVTVIVSVVFVVVGILLFCKGKGIYTMPNFQNYISLNNTYKEISLNIEITLIRFKINNFLFTL